MSKFFGKSDDSASESSSSSDDEVPAIKVPSRFAKSTAVNEPEDVEVKKRTVRSARDKAIDELRTTGNQIKKHMKKGEHGDWNAISTEFDKLNKILEKSKQVLKNEIPNCYIRCLVQLEDFEKEVSESKTKSKMNALNLKNYQTMKQKLKKHNKNFEAKIQAFRKNPPPASDEEKESSDEELDDEEGGFFKTPTFEDKPTKKAAPVPAKTPAKPVKPTNVDENNESEESEEGEDNEGGFTAVTSQRNKWLKSEEKKRPEEKKKPDEKKSTTNFFKKTEDEKVKKPAETKKIEELKKTETPTVDEKKKEKKSEKELDEKDIKHKLGDLLKERGKKNTDVRKQIEAISKLLVHSEKKKFDLHLLVLTQLVAFQFDINKATSDIMPTGIWKQIYENLSKILNILDSHKDFVYPEAEINDAGAISTSSLSLSIEEEINLSSIGGNLLAFVDRLDQEFYKQVRNLDSRSPEYNIRLQEENLLLILAERTQSYYERIQKFDKVALLAALRIEHLYFKVHSSSLNPLPDFVSLNSFSSIPTSTKSENTPQPLKKDLSASQQFNLSASSVLLLPQKTIDIKNFEKLTDIVYTYGDARTKTRTMLCHIYYYALHDRFYQARDMMLMSRLQDAIQNINEKETLVLFNRTMVQLGLSAFRAGLIKHAYTCLAEMNNFGKINRDLLAQYPISKKKTLLEVPPVDRVPAHMHINAELVEVVHLICTLLAEVPNMAANQFDARKKIGRSFKVLLDHFDKQLITGPPETTRDIVVHAAYALLDGEWKRCQELLASLPVWNTVSNPEQIKAMLKRKVQEEGLRTYIFKFSNYYDSLGLEQLVQTFELPSNVVHSIVSKMINNEELHASWDQPTGSLIMHKVDPSKLQFLALQFSDKLSLFVEANDRLTTLTDASGPKTGQKGPRKSYNKTDQKGGKRDERGGEGQRRGGKEGGRGGQRRGGNRDHQQEGGRGGQRRGGNRDHQQEGEGRGGHYNYREGGQGQGQGQRYQDNKQRGNKQQRSSNQSRHQNSLSNSNRSNE